MNHGILGLSVFDLSLHDVIVNVPHDPAAFVVYLLLGTFVGLIWMGSRRSTIERHRRPASPTGDPDHLSSRQTGHEAG